MRKGVSPVVAIVLLIAIAVISAVAVWSWVSPLTSKPPMGSTTQYAISVLNCYASTNTIDIKNSGGVKISAQSWSLTDSATGSTLNATALNGAQTLLPGEVNSSVGVYYDVTSGSSYSLRATNFPDFKFTCS